MPNAHTGAPPVLATGRPVLYMGGSGGGDPVIDATGLVEMAANGELRYVLFGGENGKQGIATCTIRAMPTIDSDGCRPPNTEHAGHPLRRMASTFSGASESVVALIRNPWTTCSGIRRQA